MGNTSIGVKQREESLLIQSDTVSNTKEEQFNKADFDDDETENEPQWTYEKRVATLRDTQLAMEAFRKACSDLKQSVSTNVDSLLNDLPDVYDPQFETKYALIRRQLLSILPKTSNLFKTSTKKERSIFYLKE